MTSARPARTPERIVGALIDAVVDNDVQMLEVWQVAEILNVTPRAVLYLLQDRKLAFIRTGKRGYRIPRETLAEYMLANFADRELTEVERKLARAQRALQKAEARLAEITARIEAAQSALRDDESHTPGRPTQAVPA